MLCERQSKEPTMNFPGACKLQLTDDAIKRAVEDALNAARREGEDYIHVTEFGRVNYGYGDGSPPSPPTPRRLSWCRSTRRQHERPRNPCGCC
jgi:hypothetical protein